MNIDNHVSQRLKHACLFYQSALFHDAQCQAVLGDGKSLVDAIPKTDYANVIDAYEAQKKRPGFDLATFIHQHFTLATSAADIQLTDADSLTDYIQRLWTPLTRQPAADENSSLLPLPHAYVVPGGRFREIYYWDSYFTALGLMLDNKRALVADMVSNFLSLQRRIGHIPNGNRLYYIGRSQPPVLALMVDLLFPRMDDPDNPEESAFYADCLEGLIQEHSFWMSSEPPLKGAHRRCVVMPNGSLLNRYWDDADGPRPESYAEDHEAVMGLPTEQQQTLWRNIRAACESGWDFSSRWMTDAHDIRTLRTTELVPVDLNGLLYLLEERLSRRLADRQPDQASHYAALAAARKQALQHYCWDAQNGRFCDWHYPSASQSPVLSAATLVPLFVGIASPQQAQAVAATTEQQLLAPGGLLTTTCQSPQQWDAPNGWAPLQWFACQGLKDYGFNTLADQIARRWLTTVTGFFSQQGTLMEKYNLIDTQRQAEGGEYQVQHGFGWTNGVTRALLAQLQKPAG